MRIVEDIVGLPHQYELWTDQRNEAEIALVGPLGCGKSFGLAIKQMLLRLVNQGTDGMLVVPTYSLAKQVHIREWPDIWKRYIGEPVTFLSQDSAFVWPTGDRTWVRSAEEPDRLVGANLGDVMFDEPGTIQEIAYRRACARARHPKATVRQKISGGTPEGLNWWAELFAEPDGVKRRTIWGREWHRDLAHYRETLMDLYGHDQALKDAYVGGKFVPLRQGRCYPAFVRDRHVRRELGYDPSLPLVLACDFNVDAMRWIVMQFDQKSIRAIDEIALGSGSTTEANLSVFLEKWSGRHTGPLVITGDRSGKARSTHSSKTDYQIILEDCVKHFPSVSRRIPSENPIIKFRIDNVNYHLGGRGREVYIHPGCRELIKDFEQVVWREGRPEEDQNKDRRRTHAAAAFGYATWMFARAITAAGGTRAGTVQMAEEKN